MKYLITVTATAGHGRPDASAHHPEWRRDQTKFLLLGNAVGYCNVYTQIFFLFFIFPVQIIEVLGLCYSETLTPLVNVNGWQWLFSSLVSSNTCVTHVAIVQVKLGLFENWVLTITGYYRKSPLVRAVNY